VTVTNAREREGSFWARFTGPPEGHEGPWPVEAGGTWLDFLSPAAIVLTSAMAISMLLKEFGAHPVLGVLASTALVCLEVSAARAWHNRSSQRAEPPKEPRSVNHPPSEVP
jgi:hypothetical protein